MSLKKYCLITILILGGAAVFLSANFSSGYNTGWTHPTLAEKSARLFNQYDGGNLSEADIGQIVQGVINEDTPPRWVNHFYDPTTGQGWSGERMGSLPASVLRLFTSIGLTQASPAAAPDWARNQALQERYSMYEGNRTFQKAVYDYVNGDKATAYRSLGHILHLVEDMTVPAHTRQDTHVDVWGSGDPGEPFEKWVEQTKDLSFLNNLNPAQENFHCRNLNDCFNQAAKYSNRNFFSEDTINDENYLTSFGLRYVKENRYYYAINTVNDSYLYRFEKDSRGNFVNLTLNDDKVHSAYWQRLSKKAVLSGAEVIRIFQEEAAKAEKDRNLLETPPPSSFSFLDKGLLTGIYGIMAPTVAAPVFSVYGAYEQVGGWMKNLWGTASSKLGSLSGSLLSLVGKADIPAASPVLPEGLTINQAAIDQLAIGQKGNNENNSPQPPLTLRGGESEGDASIVNIIPQNFPSTGSGQVPSAPQPSSWQASSGDALQPINIVPKMPLALSSSNEMVLGETIVNGNENGNKNQTAATAKTSAKTSVSNPTVPLGAGAGASGQSSVEQELSSESPTAISTPEENLSPSEDQLEETASTTEEDLVPPETYATSTPILMSQTDSTSSPQALATSTIIFEFSSSEAPSSGSGQALSTFACRLDSASSTVCASPMEYRELSDGEHEFEVKAIDAAGNADPTPVIFNWIVDATVPEVSLSLANYQLTSINFSLVWNSSSSDVVSYEIQNKLGEGGGWQDWATSATSSQKNFRANRDETTYYFRGRAMDDLGNQSAWQEIAAEISLYPIAINEIAWMGTAAKYSSDEWIELYNKTDQDIDLNGWTLSVSGRNIILATTIPAHGFYLLERSDNKTVFDIAADQVYVGGMDNGIEILELRNQAGQLIDSTPPKDHSPGYAWVAGEASPNYKTMERVNPYRDGANVQNWKTNNGVIINGLAADGITPIHGTPKAQNSQYDPTLAVSTIIPDKTVINLDTIWSLGRSPYILESNAGAYPTLAAGATLIIEPDVIVKPSSILIIKGTLLARGTSEKPILFTSNQPTPQPGDWASIVFKPESVGSVLENAIFEYGGREFSGYHYDDYSMVNIDQSLVTIKNCQFQKGGWIALKLNNSSSPIENSVFLENIKGIVIDGAASHPIVRDSEFRGANHRGTGIEISNGAAPIISSNNFYNLNYPILLKNASPVFSGNLVSNNNHNGVYVHWQTTFTQDLVWQNNLTYILMSNYGDYPTVASGTVLTIEPGTIIKPFSRYTAMVVQGRLEAEGTESEPIIFTSFKDDSFGGDSNNDRNLTSPADDDLFDSANRGEWYNIVFAAGSSGSLSNIHFQYGGYIPGWRPSYDPDKTLNRDPSAEVDLGDGVTIN
ncbi:MAG: lamin tail domain-containing protein [Candidatus Portnoybacteria bacterium]|nr:lamin tail domain-containing protein [Candidatus Portnoybacteria bacterium]